MNDVTRPRSPYLAQRETLDEGFSRGWMPHFLPSEEYWIDMHAHLKDIANADCLRAVLDEWFSRLDAYRLGAVVAITEQEDLFEVFGDAAEKDSRFAWMYWPKIAAPSVSLVREAVRNGACSLKLHNRPIMEGDVPRHIWQRPEWQEVFSFAETAGIPILWHVTQRLSYSPYHGGGLNPYWQRGWTEGVDCTNEDLLQDILVIMRRFPNLKIIGAHQFYVGLERLNDLFAEYRNLYIDSSVGMYLRWANEFVDEDRVSLRNFVVKWSERILFGTDANLFPGCSDEYAVQGFLCHARFLLKLWLDDEPLQNVAWRNAQRLMRLKPVSSARRGNVRP